MGKECSARRSPPWGRPCAGNECRRHIQEGHGAEEGPCPGLKIEETEGLIASLGSSHQQPKSGIWNRVIEQGILWRKEAVVENQNCSKVAKPANVEVAIFS